MSLKLNLLVPSGTNWRRTNRLVPSTTHPVYPDWGLVLHIDWGSGHADTQTHGHADTRTHGHSDTGTYGHTETRTRGHTDTHGHTDSGHTDTRTLGHADTRIRIHADIRRYGHTDTRTLGHTDTRAHASPMPSEAARSLYSAILTTCASFCTLCVLHALWLLRNLQLASFQLQYDIALSPAVCIAITGSSNMCVILVQSVELLLLLLLL